MKVCCIYKTGGTGVLTFEDFPIGEVKNNEILVKINYAGLNFIDIYFREGIYTPPQFPFVLGKEGIGTVVAVGKGVTNFKQDDTVVFSDCVTGSYAQYAIVKETLAIKIDNKLDKKEVVASFVQGLTAHYLITASYQIKPKDKILVHAASGGVGLLLIQMAKLKGAYVIGTVSNSQKAQLAKSYGADEVIVYTDYQFKDKIMASTNKKGCNVVYDSVGKPTFEQSLAVTCMRGTVVLYGQSGGVVPPFDLNRLNAAGSLFVTRPTLFHHIANYDEYLQRASDIFDWINTGKLNIKIYQIFPFEQIPQAHNVIEQRLSTGKILIKIS